MDESVFSTLAQWLDEEAVVLASVVEARGATPRGVDARMLIAANRTAFSIGGGALEARVIAAARDLLRKGGERAGLDITLDGKPSAAGVCGGRMRIALRRFSGAVDRRMAGDIAAKLRAGETVSMPARELGDDEAPAMQQNVLHPRPRLLIAGAGHCGAALCELARHLEFDLHIVDPRAGFLSDAAFTPATVHADFAQLRDAANTSRDLYIVLLNRDFASDVTTLSELRGVPCVYLGMMGSRRRIAQVRSALPDDAWFERIVAPVGLSIDAQTPHEIAVSILAQLIQVRRKRESGRD